MTENQRAALDELSLYRKLHDDLQMFRRHYDRAADDIGPPPTWPSVGVVPGVKRSKPVKDNYYTPKYARDRDPNYYAFEERGTADRVELLPKAWDVLPSKELLLMLSDMICEMSVLDPHWLPERERRKAYMAAHGFSGLTLCEDGIRRLDLSKIERNKVIDG